MHLSLGQEIYLAAWSFFTLLAVVLAATDIRVRLDLGPYLRYLAMPWKIAVFVPAALFVTFAGRFAYDDTWDLVTGAGMSFLTFLTAPWAVGSAWLVLQEQRPSRHMTIAVVACLFSASWFYDGWLLYRDGVYSDMAIPNLLLSPFLYVAGGLLWNLEVDENGRPTFGFLRIDWPHPPRNGQIRLRLAVAALPPIAIAAGILLFSVQWRY